jgi:3-oxoacyl-[acyl-carrier-protein] synthase II
VNVAGIGVVFARGRGIAALEKALLDGWQQPSVRDSSPVAGGKRPVYQVNVASMQDKTLLKKIRRADKLSKMAVLAAADALSDSKRVDIDRKKLGVIVATGLGAHVTTFSFLDDILDYGDAAVSPTTFSNSVHNAAASYVSSSLDIQGPTLTITQFRFSFQAALQLAQTWISQGRCEYILVGAADQYGDVLGYVSDQKLNTAIDGKIKPFTFKPTCQVPGEGAAFFLLSSERAGNCYCSVEAVHTGDYPGKPKSVDINIIDADGMLPDESAYRRCLSDDIPTASYSPLFGSMMIGSAFNIAAGALMLKRQMRYATPVRVNPHDVFLLAESGSSHIGTICCTGYDCYGERSIVYLTKV